MKRFKDILFVADSDIDNSAAFRKALDLATNNHARLAVLSVIDDAPRMPERLRDALQQQHREVIAQLEGMAASYRVDVTTRTIAGRRSLGIIGEVLRHGHDLVIKSISAERYRSFVGSDMKLLRKCPCPVWIIKPTVSDAFHDVLVAIDREDDNPASELLNRQLLEMAAALALSEFATLHVVHAWRLPYEDFCRSASSGLTQAEVDDMLADEEAQHREWFDDIVSRFCRTVGTDTSGYLDPRTRLIYGDPAQVIVNCARDIGADLVVMGTISRAGVPGLLIGDTAEAILERIDCSILAVKPPGFVSPVAAIDG